MLARGRGLRRRDKDGGRAPYTSGRVGLLSIGVVQVQEQDGRCAERRAPRGVSFGRIRMSSAGAGF